MMQKKVCLLGASGVGKTSLIKQYVEGIFSEKYLTSIGVKIDKKQVETKSGPVKLMIWDIEGIDRYCGFQPKYLRGASAYIIVSDQTRSQSLLEGVEIQKMIKEVTDIPGLLAINKSDLPEAWHWSQKELEEIQSGYEKTFYTSAKTGENVENMFTHLAQIIAE
ncbi:MAG: Rab family GTPase [Paraglaciecola sp.]|uniref:Rab family GTPase n=1 Tax=Paraglaciecola sp. TaxID=1920173 RepID=UPI00329931B7